MRKFKFYARLATTNLIHNRQTYIPYLIASVISIASYYILHAMSLAPDLTTLRGADYVQIFTRIGLVILTIFCAILIFYTNSFLIKRRKKEMGLYSILGMEKRNLSVLMLFENVIVTLVALILGLSLGILLARLFFLLYFKLIKMPIAVEIPVSPKSLAVTAIVFSLIYLLTLVTNLIRVRKSNPIQLMSGAKQGEREPKASWFITLLGIVTLVLGYRLAIDKNMDAVNTILIFLPAAFLVIIATFCLFTSGSVALLKGLRKNKRYYYKKDHFISVSGMIYRMKQNAAGLAAICILSCMVLVTLSSTVALYAGFTDQSNNFYAHDYTITLYDTTDQQIRESESYIKEIAKENDIEITGYRSSQFYTEHMYALSENEFLSFGYIDSSESGQTVFFMTLDSYNQFQGVHETLEPGQALVFWEGISYTQPTILLNEQSFNVKAPVYTDRYDDHVLTVVLPNQQSIYDTLLPTMPDDVNTPVEDYFLFHYNVQLDIGEARYEDEFRFQEALYAMDQNVKYSTGGMYIISRFEWTQNWYATNGGFLFLGIFLGSVFLMAAAIIIYYKQLSEGYDDRERFIILQKVGMSAREVKKTIGKQVRTVFYLPLIVAVIHIMFAFPAIKRAMDLFDYAGTGFNGTVLLLANLGVAAIYALIYVFIYRRTAKTYFNIVRMA